MKTTNNILKNKFRTKRTTERKHEFNLSQKIAVSVRNFSFFYSEHQAVKNVTLDIPKNKITAIIGPSGCGKSTFLRSFNRMNDEIVGYKYSGEIIIDNQNILDPVIDLITLRSKVGMVFQKPTPFPQSIWKNIAYGPMIRGIKNKGQLNQIVEFSLKRAGLWKEVNERLDDKASQLSGGQQQRLCIARALAVWPEIILFDEPCASLDPISTSVIEDLLLDLAKDYTVIIATHSMHQAARISNMTAFMYLGELIEYDKTEKIFENPAKELTEQYITGRFG
ncbi:MAG: phosphate ABC transporter ATP-binding protein PstB [Candidatus Heimdallarchaeaceae archaeon]